MCVQGGGLGLAHTQLRCSSCPLRWELGVCAGRRAWARTQLRSSGSLCSGSWLSCHLPPPALTTGHLHSCMNWCVPSPPSNQRPSLQGELPLSHSLPSCLYFLPLNTPWECHSSVFTCLSVFWQTSAEHGSLLQSS